MLAKDSENWTSLYVYKKKKVESCLLFQVKHKADFNIIFIESFNEKEDFETLIRPLISKS